ncbi:MAG: serine/threonine-protein phosphatase [Acidobacteria bacterium]|jgi:serine phosphatase RsbU (regulator of sigma subunit)|nr:serine/threonine-protein phosphatase [Acidobacteriota bacterium]
MENKNDQTDVYKTLKFLRHEMENFGDIAKKLKPSSGEIPSINGIDIYGEAIPFNGIAGGDHIIYVDFNKRYDLDQRIIEAKKMNRPEIVEKLLLNKKRAGIMIADAAGHNITDALLVAMLHQAFLTGVQYELKQNGEVTLELFEIINSRFFNSSSLTKFITLIYGEISEAGKFRFISAGHPLPVVFSNMYNKLVKICFDRMFRFPPIGTLPSRDDVDCERNFSRLGYKRKYSVHEINLMGSGDILLLYSDGFSEHRNDDDILYMPRRLEEVLNRIKELNAKEIYFNLKKDLLNFASPKDDISFVVVKKL